ncbi:DUF560 domain-containing protein [Candidatus Pacearchaeota archaeon]|nr:DUF560 domain-containing protein [Candidatus Pacearchaeota archaeon]
MNVFSLLIKDDKKMLRSILNSSLLVASCAVVDVSASSISLESEVNARATYDDNVRFPADGESASIFMIMPKMKLAYESDSWETAINARASGTTYSSAFQDQIDSYIDIGTAYKDDRDIYSVSVGYDNHSNRTTDTNFLGVTPDQVERRTITLAPTYTRLLTERASLSLTYSYANEHYKSNSSGVLLPFETQTATGVMAYNLSQKSELIFEVYMTDYESENKISEYQITGAKIGIEHKFSKMISGKIFAGMNERDFVTRSSQNFPFSGSTITGTQAVETSSNGAIFEAAIDMKWVELQASRDTVVNSIGGLDQTDNASVKFRMQVTPLIGITLLIKKEEINELNNNVIDQSRTYSSIIPAMTFSLARNLSLRAEYIRGEQEVLGTQGLSSKYNRFSVNLKYNFPTI